jgi:hypothetical protein
MWQGETICYIFTVQARFDKKAEKEECADMANTLATPHWDEIRRLAEQGVPMPDIARAFVVSEKTIYNKSAQEDWLTPSRLKAKISRSRQTLHSGIGGEPLLSQKDATEISDSLLLDTWETRAESLRNLSYSVAVEAIKSAKGQIVLESASDLKHAVHVARQATGVLDTETPAVQLSLFAGSPDSGPRIIEAMDCAPDALQQDTELAGFWE